MFDTVLIANRGEIAVRIAKTLRRMGIRSVAVYSDADTATPAVRVADDAVRIGPASARESYLDIQRILGAARRAGAQAIHPGYGFLSENPAFASACEKAGLAFIGPPAAAIEAMGDKIRAKQTVAAAGVPTVPGRTDHGMSDAELADAAAEVGYPILLKPSAGGGGKGMRLVSTEADLAVAIESARRESAAAFGDDTLLVERFVQRPRHIEIQVLADDHGNVVHLGERECSLQRRHQKIVEEAPSPLISDVTRQRMGQAAVDAARSCGYRGAGTVEFIVSAEKPAEFFFMEMNTRLQVEHPVTELVTGVDLVEQQVRIAAGEPIGFEQAPPRGHAIEARVYAEDPDSGFLPTGGEVLVLDEPGDVVRVDSGIAAGCVVSTDYDPMLAKYIGYGEDRAAALRSLRAGLTRATVLGVRTNIGFLLRLLSDPDVVSGAIDTELVERKLDSLTGGDVPHDVLVAAVAERALALADRDGGPWAIADGWRIGGRAWSMWQVRVPDGQPVTVRLLPGADRMAVTIADSEPVDASAHLEGDTLVVRTDEIRRYACARSGGVLWLGRGGRTWELTERSRLDSERTASEVDLSGELESPMPGTVLAVKVHTGERVSAGQPVVIVEAMKMEYAVPSVIDGVIEALHVKEGQQVALAQPLALVSSRDEKGNEQ